MTSPSRTKRFSALRSSGKYLAAGVLIVLILAWQGGLFNAKRRANESPDPRPSAEGADVVEVREEILPVLRTFTASVMPRETVELSAQISGEVLAVDVSPGQRVEKGDVVLRVDPALTEAQRAQAEAALEMASENLRGTERLFEHISAAAEANAVPRTEAIDAERVRDRAARAVEQRRAALDAAELRAGYAQITSPLSGRVMDTLYDPGDLVLPGRPVMLLYNPSELEVVTFVPADLADAFSPGTEVEIHLSALDRTLTGRVRNRTDRVDPASRSVEVKLTFDPPPGALPGMYAEARLSVRSKPALVVPATAVEPLRGLRYVRVVTADNRIDRRLVRPGRELDGRVEILAGLNPGDQVLRVAAALPETGEAE